MMKQLVTEYLTLTRLTTERPKAFDATRENKPSSPSSSASTASTKVSTISQTLLFHNGTNPATGLESKPEMKVKKGS
jgi:hypothetical protein